MKLSRYVKYIEIKDGLFSVFNSLICEPVFMSQLELESLIHESLDCFSESECQSLKNLGILVSDSKADDNALKTLRLPVRNGVNSVGVMYLIPTSACNLACKYCFIGKLDSPCKRVDMTWEIARTAIDKFQAHVEARGLSEANIILYGGEPLIQWPLVLQAARYLKESSSKIKLGVVTNGTLLTEKMLDDVKQLGIEIGISIDGPKQITDASRVFKGGEIGVYEGVMKTIATLKEHDVSFELSVTVSDSVVENEDEVIQWLIDVGAPVFFNLLHFTDKSKDWKKYYYRASKFVLRAYEKLQLSGVREGRVERKVDFFHNRKFSFSDCAARNGNQLTVGPDGEICVCHGYWNTDRHKCGNILEDDFTDVFQTDEYQSWRKNLTINKEECLNCEAIYVCGGGCAQQAETLFGDCKDIDRCFCIHTKTALKWLLLKHYLNDSN